MMREILIIEKINSAVKCLIFEDHPRCETHTFSKVTHTKDIDQTDQNANDRGIERDMFCLQGLVLFAKREHTVTYIRVPERK